MHAVDGNNSAKRVDGSGNADERCFQSDYLLHASKVDRFKDEVKSRSKTQVGNSVLDQPPFGDTNDPCTDNWIAANAISEETVKVFDQTGIFLCACRHGIVEMIAEMRRSGEL
jgi:Kyakuja-Dileera-Zisupton transposase